MLILILGLLLFFVPHLSREFGFRDRLIAATPSHGAYMGLHSLVALTGLGLIVWGKSLAPFVMVWQPLFELRYLSSLLMIPAFILLVAGNIPMSFMRWQFRNPMLFGVMLWGIAHLWSNGDLASILLFGGFTLWSGFKFFSLWRVQQPPAMIELKWLIRDLIALLAGMLLFFVVYVSHGQLFGVGLNFV